MYLCKRTLHSFFFQTPNLWQLLRLTPDPGQSCENSPDWTELGFGVGDEVTIQAKAESGPKEKTFYVVCLLLLNKLKLTNLPL